MWVILYMYTHWSNGLNNMWVILYMYTHWSNGLNNMWVILYMYTHWSNGYNNPSLSPKTRSPPPISLLSPTTPFEHPLNWCDLAISNHILRSPFTFALLPSIHASRNCLQSSSKLSVVAVEHAKCRFRKEGLSNVCFADRLSTITTQSILMPTNLQTMASKHRLLQSKCWSHLRPLSNYLSCKSTVLCCSALKPLKQKATK